MLTMYCNLDELPIKVVKTGKTINFIYEGKEYFFKMIPYEKILKELVAEKIANRFGLDCCHCFPAIYQGKRGVVSEAAYGIWDIGYKLMNTYIQENDFTINIENIDKYNNLEDIWNFLYYDLDIPSDTVKKLMDEVTDIFIFDALIGNIDRHRKNFGIISNGKESRIAAIFDNDKMLSELAINNGKYNLAVESGERPISTPGNFLYKFLDISDKSYQERLKEGLEIISEESLSEIFQQLETEGIILDTIVVSKMLEKFVQNRKMINSYFTKKNSRHQ